MATGFGIDPTLNGSGVPTSGTSSKDIRNISAGLYSPGIITGAAVLTSASAMSYSTTAGVVAIPIATGETVLAPVPATVVPTAAAPSSGTRIDIIYATQSMPTIDGNSNVVVRVGTSLPARSVELGRRIITANILNTNSATKTGEIDYSIPYGASLGILHQYRDTRNGIINHARTIVNSKSIYLPTDRQVKLSIISSMSSRDAGRWEVAKYCSVSYDVAVDGKYRSHFGSGGLDQAWQTFHFSDIYTLSAGTHIFRFEMLRRDGPGYPYAHYGAGWGGTLWTIEDLSPVK